MFPQEHQDKFAKLRAHFLSGLHAREAELEDLSASLLTKRHCRKSLEELYIASHKLAGICATYGFVTAGEQAARTEALIERSKSTKPSEDQIYEILLETELLTDELRRIVGSDAG